MKTQHTPTPWIVQQYTNYEGFSISGPEGECLAERWYERPRTPEQNEVLAANAAFIVKACNAHDELLHAAQWALDWMHGKHMGANTETLLINAIAKAKGAA